MQRLSHCLGTNRDKSRCYNASTCGNVAHTSSRRTRRHISCSPYRPPTCAFRFQQSR
nr:MAG TPA: hypothetical protein [Caudoviricetes sp.]